MSTLVTPRRQNLLPHLIAVDVRNDSITVRVGELDGEGLEGVALGHVVLDPVLELDRGEIPTPNPLELVVGKGRGKQVAELGVPLCAAVVLVTPQRAHFLLKDALKHSFFVSDIEVIAGHEVANGWVWCKRVDILR